MRAKVSDSAARVLIEGWYSSEPGMSLEDAQIHFPRKTGDVVDLDCVILEALADGWYVREPDPVSPVQLLRLEALSRGL